MKRILSIFFALTLIPVLAVAKSNESHVIGKSFNLNVDDRFAKIYLQQESNDQGGSVDNVVMEGVANNATLYLSISPVFIKGENTAPIDPQLVSLVKTSFDGFAKEIKRIHNSAHTKVNRIKAITLAGAPAQELTFTSTFKGMTSKGIAIAAYEKPYLTIVMGTATANKDKYAVNGLKTVEEAIDTMALEVSQSFGHRYSNEDFRMPVPSDIGLINTESDDVDGFKYYRVVNFQGGDARSKTKISVSSFAFNDQTARGRQDKMPRALKKRLTYFINQYMAENPGARVSKQSIDNFKLDGKPALRQPFEIIGNGKKTEGAVIIVQDGAKMHLILAHVQGKSSSFDDNAVERVKNSLWKMTF